jgi:hypothetical protein
LAACFSAITEQDEAPVIIADYRGFLVFVVLFRVFSAPRINDFGVLFWHYQSYSRLNVTASRSRNEFRPSPQTFFRM